MKFELKQKFPCGYEIVFKIKGFGLRDFSDILIYKNCPLHGNKCFKKQEKKQ